MGVGSIDQYTDKHRIGCIDRCMVGCVDGFMDKG